MPASPARRLVTVALFLAPAAAGASPTDADALARALSRAAPAANPKVLALATRALKCVQRSMPTNTLSVIDYSLPSTTPRLWVFELRRQPRLLFHEWVAHGRNSGDNLATRFSNTPGSLMSSLGTFVTDGTYTGHNGYSLRLKGIDGRFNDRAEERAIVIHGARYVSKAFASSQGRLGRSWGCPAVRAGVAHKLIDAIARQSVVFAYYPDQRWLQTSRLLGDCGGDEALSSR
ncbi:MAG TPA: murein L,D-transpeptidase catalytic domain family protein [Frateuria sp.]|uniref:murein L,D-transpeptidase catalytic domain family protein n=1 Tax=Frateuria sp. TaxID=2211372 RepID=UPI002D7F5B4A|nr:murein L,D-transpeptidase catalytic domain family protein [Frateuria sp.]HET6805540.1 murein L,D-transpeptidase catalytic domain family protein [Frateuria sp.]